MDAAAEQVGAPLPADVAEAEASVRRAFEQAVTVRLWIADLPAPGSALPPLELLELTLQPLREAQLRAEAAPDDDEAQLDLWNTEAIVARELTGLAGSFVSDEIRFRRYDARTAITLRRAHCYRAPAPRRLGRPRATARRRRRQGCATSRARSPGREPEEPHLTFHRGRR